uniref:Uncharacterized protein n=1 Tax=Anguilla anguilla TaxID=7936 RepID=A0A0E9RX27_ANGAN
MCHFPFHAFINLALRLNCLYVLAND